MRPLSSSRPHRRAAGMTLVEAVVAMLLLSICLLPAAEALRTAIAAPANTALAARDLDCVSAQMETVLGESYDRLLAAADAIDKPSPYSVGATASCPAVDVFVARYGNDGTRKIGPGGSSSYLLYVGAQLADATASQPYPLATLVAR